MRFGLQYATKFVGDKSHEDINAKTFELKAGLTCHL